MKKFQLYHAFFSNHALIYTDLKFILINLKKIQNGMAGTHYSDSFFIVRMFPRSPYTSPFVLCGREALFPIWLL